MSGSELTYLVSRCTRLKEVFAVLASAEEVPDGVIRVLGSKVNGRIGIQGGRYIEGVILSAGTESGLPALERVLEEINTGIFQFMPSYDPDIVPDQHLHFDIGEIPDLPESHDFTRDDNRTVIPLPMMDQTALPALAILENSLPVITEGHLPLFHEFRGINSETEREVFLANNPEFEEIQQYTTLSPEQLKMLSTYRKLSSPADKMSFLAQNSFFSDLMQETAMSEGKRSELTAAKAAFVDDSVKAFVAYQNGGTALSEEQVQLLNQIYGQFATEKEREAFFGEHPGFQEMMTNTELSAEKMAQLEQAQFRHLESEIQGFEQFQSQILGPDHPELDPGQIEMLRNMYRQLANETNRQAFLSENPVLWDQAPVERGEALMRELEERMKQTDFAPPEPGLGSPTRAVSGIMAIDMDTGLSDHSVDRPMGEDAQIDSLRRKSASLLVHPEMIGWATAGVIFLCICGIGQHMLSNSMSVDNITPQQEEEEVSQNLERSVPGQVPDAVSDLNRPLPVGVTLVYGPHGQQSSSSASYSAVLTNAQRMMSEEKYSQAAALFQSILDENPDDTDARIGLIQAYKKLKKHGRAREICIAGLKRAKTRKDRETFERLFAMVQLDTPEERQAP